jgi:peptidoglycan hydrolase CwlO-like protein
MPTADEEEMRLTPLKRFLAAGGSVVSWLNTFLILATGVAAALYWIYGQENDSKATTNALTTVSAQLTNINLQIEQTKREQAERDEKNKQEQKEALEKVAKDFKDSFNALTSKQDITQGQLQAIQVTNQGFIGRFDLIDAKLTQVSRQVDSVDGRTTSLEKRVSDAEAGLSVLKALFERIGRK